MHYITSQFFKKIKKQKVLHFIEKKLLLKIINNLDNVSLQKKLSNSILLSSFIVPGICKELLLIKLLSGHFNLQDEISFMAFRDTRW